MSRKNTDSQGRFRSRTIAFRMSPEEADLLQRMADASGLPKQEYLINRSLCREVTVVFNNCIQYYMEDDMFYVCEKLRRLESAGEMPPELVELICALGDIYIGLGYDILDKGTPILDESDLIMEMVR